MAKYIKFVIETDDSLSDIFDKSVSFASKFGEYKIYCWDTENIENTLSASSKKLPCRRIVGKVSGRLLVCGKDDYLCPECKLLVQ